MATETDFRIPPFSENGWTEHIPDGNVSGTDQQKTGNTSRFSNVQIIPPVTKHLELFSVSDLRPPAPRIWINPGDAHVRLETDLPLTQPRPIVRMPIRQRAPEVSVQLALFPRSMPATETHHHAPGIVLPHAKSYADNGVPMSPQVKSGSRTIEIGGIRSAIKEGNIQPAQETSAPTIRGTLFKLLRQNPIYRRLRKNS